jgi:membrane-associated phospholipid phosphatase
MPTAHSTLLEPVRAPTRDSANTAHDSAPRHRLRPAVAVTIIGYVVLTALMLGIGLLLTHALDGTVGAWDRHVSAHFAGHRTSDSNEITKVATSLVNTLPAVLIAALVDAFLALRRRWREAAFLAIALFLEITVFLSVTFVVDRPRPAVPRLNSTPSTGSFPSGHTAAATVLFVGIALIVAWCTRNTLARLVSALLGTAFAATVGFARVYRGLHYTSDVIVGALLGLACLTVAAIAVRAVSARPQESAEPRSADERRRYEGLRRTA